MHIDNLASYISFIHSGFKEYSRFDKEVKREDFEAFLSSGLLKATTLNKAKNSLFHATNNVIVKYAILIKEI